MELKEALTRRRSLRRYSTQPVERATITQLLEAANLAPSGANASPWLYVVVDDPQLKASIRKASEEADRQWNAAQPGWFQSWLETQGISSRKEFLEEAPLLVVAFADTQLPYAVESSWMSIAYLLLAVTEFGLGTLTYTPGDTAFLGPLLGVPAHCRAQAILPIGYPAEAVDSTLRPKKQVQATACLNHYQQPYLA